MDDQTPVVRKSVCQTIREIVETAVIAALCYAVVSTAIGRFEIKQISMEPNLHAGQRVIVVRWEPWLASIARAEDGQAATTSTFKQGQVVVFYPDAAHQETPLIKRVIGVPGDVVSIADGQVWLNGQPLDETYVHGLSTDCTYYCGPLVLGPHQYFVMGDNRPHSGDSRAFGPVAEGDIIGHVVLRYWPPDALAFYP